MVRVLLLGGTADASRLARMLADAGIDAMYSYAGRTVAPAAQPLPTRVGGFGGVDGLADYLVRERFTHIIDATHPFAAQISNNAVAAGQRAGIPLMAFVREPWEAIEGDSWHRVANLDEAVTALPEAPARVFLAIGRQHLAPFATRPEHAYLLRFVDDPQDELPLPNVRIVVARGPFTVAGDLALLSRERITHIVARNAGGNAARAKLDAARLLSLPVIMIERPPTPERRETDDAGAIFDWLDHRHDLGV